jgi:hypothetical protein
VNEALPFYQGRGMGKIVGRGLSGSKKQMIMKIMNRKGIQRLF